MAAAVIRRCHKCQLPMLKEEGCNKLTCRCGATLCYLCRAPNINYEHFCRHPLDPGQACKQCSACLLWEKPTVRDEKALQELEERGRRTAEEIGMNGERSFGGGSGAF